MVRTFAIPARVEVVERPPVHPNDASEGAHPQRAAAVVHDGQDAATGQAVRARIAPQPAFAHPIQAPERRDPEAVPIVVERGHDGVQQPAAHLVLRAATALHAGKTGSVGARPDAAVGGGEQGGDVREVLGTRGVGHGAVAEAGQPAARPDPDITLVVLLDRGDVAASQAGCGIHANEIAASHLPQALTRSDPERSGPVLEHGEDHGVRQPRQDGASRHAVPVDVVQAGPCPHPHPAAARADHRGDEAVGEPLPHAHGPERSSPQARESVARPYPHAAPGILEKGMDEVAWQPVPGGERLEAPSVKPPEAATVGADPEHAARIGKQPSHPSAARLAGRAKCRDAPAGQVPQAVGVGRDPQGPGRVLPEIQDVVVDRGIGWTVVGQGPGLHAVGPQAAVVPARQAASIRADPDPLVRRLVDDAYGVVGETIAGAQGPESLPLPDTDAFLVRPDPEAPLPVFEERADAQGAEAVGGADGGEAPPLVDVEARAVLADPEPPLAVLQQRVNVVDLELTLIEGRETDPVEPHQALGVPIFFIAILVRRDPETPLPVFEERADAQGPRPSAGPMAVKRPCS